MSEATRIPELFGSLVFNERTMEQYVPQSAMDVWRGCLKSGQPLPLSAANEIADAMKTWALEHGATHFTHWFQPLSGVTAEKHCAAAPCSAQSPRKARSWTTTTSARSVPAWPPT